jgi:nucleotide-binding universal stress UspA family protein
MDVQPFSTILVPVDFTEPSLNALAVAVRLSQPQHTEIHLIYVLNPATVEPATANGQVPDLSQEHLAQEGTDMIQMLATVTAQEYQVHCSASYCQGKIPEEVVSTASRINADLIVIGIQNGANAETFRLGADAYQIIKTISCPVLTVPVHQKWITFERILFPVRPVPGTLDKYAFTRKIIQTDQTEVTILALCAPDEVISMHQLADEVAVLTEKLTQDNIRNQAIFCQTDSMAETVLEKVDELNTNLLIITASLSITTENYFMGPFTQQIVYNSRVPVLAIRPESALTEQTTRIAWQYGQNE